MSLMFNADRAQKNNTALIRITKVFNFEEEYS